MTISTQKKSKKTNPQDEKVKRLLLHFVGFIVLLLVIVNAPKKTEGVQIPQFSLQTQHGALITSEIIEGKPAIITFWRPSCVFCINELAKLSQINAELGGDVVVIGINRGGNPKDTQKFVEAIGVDGGMTFLVDSEDSLYDEFGGRTMPTTFFVRKDGSYFAHNGAVDLDILRADAKLIRE
jgi:thiol-disulfide isomerase/thioredoxin